MKKITLLALLVTMNYQLANQYLFQKSDVSNGRGPASVSESIKMSSNENTKIKKSWSFKYKDLAQQSFSIKKEANSYEEAYKSASKECFQILTDGKYPGEEKGLDIIDICANPKS